jgi:hypothetical protein
LKTRPCMLGPGSSNTPMAFHGTASERWPQKVADTLQKQYRMSCSEPRPSLTVEQNYNTGAGWVGKRERGIWRFQSQPSGPCYPQGAYHWFCWLCLPASRDEALLRSAYSDDQTSAWRRSSLPSSWIRSCRDVCTGVLATSAVID